MKLIPLLLLFAPASAALFLLMRRNASGKSLIDNAANAIKPVEDLLSAPFKPFFTAPSETVTSAQPVAAFTISQNGLAFIQSHESFSPHVYNDAGKLAIGYGHDLVAGDGLNANSVITEAQASQLMLRDLAPVVAVIRSIPVPLTQPQFDALCSFVYNIGVSAFRASTMFRYLSAGNITAALGEFGRWIFSQNAVNPTLQARRAAEASLFSNG